jgi:cell division protein ZipA
MEQVWETLTGDLRLALLAVGALFLAALLIWEFLQRRRARRAEETHIAGAYGQSRHGSGPSRDPLLEGRSAGDAAGSGEDAAASWSDDGFVDGVGPVREIPLGSQEASAPAGAGGRREPTFSLPQVAVRDRLAEPRVVDLESAIGTPTDGAGLLVVDSVTLSDDLSRAQSPFAPAPPETPEAAPAWVEPVAAATVDAAPTPSPESASPESASPQPASPATPSPAPQTAPQVESERRIVALRVVARNGERFTGTSVRQALQGEGFVHGDMQIFHRTAGDGRALLSAASLTRPGSFDLATMDAALYRGLNLFAVLPGPLPARDTVDKLLLSGHTLAQRLRGDLLDSRGEPLTESRLAEMRREAAAADPG